EHNHDDQRSRLRAKGASASLAEAHSENARAEAGARRERREETQTRTSDVTLRRPVLDTRERNGASVSGVGVGPHVISNVVSALRRCRQPVPARVALLDGRPVRVTTDRRGFAGGAVLQCVGPWRTSGHWWAGGAG